jgi:hypothetical protein
MDQVNTHPLYKKHNIDSAMNSIWDFYKKRFLSLFLISFVMSLVIQYVTTFVNIQELTGITDPMEMLEKMKDMMLPILIISLVNLFFNVILQYYVIYNPLERANTIFVAALNSLRYFVPYLIVMILLAFAGSILIVLGIFVLIVGVFFSFLYVMTLYLLVLPIMMVEGPNISRTITRTLSLTHRNFWPNLGWVAVFIIILIVISLVSSGLILLPFTGSFLKTIINPGETSELVNLTRNPLYIVLSAMAGALTFPLIPLVSCVLYFNGKAGEDMAMEAAVIDPENTRIRVEDLYAKPYSDDHPDNPDNKQ